MSANTSCPICRRKAHDPFRPFCSKRCADIDLGRWFTEQYSAPVRDDEEPDESPDSAA